MSTSISTVLCLPAREIEALLQGRSIGAVSKAYVYPGQKFGLCADDIGCETASIQAWASCEVCQPIDSFDGLDSLSRLIVKPVENLRQILSEKKYIFLAYLRVYLLPKPIETPVKIQGQFAALLTPTGVNASQPVFNDSVFAQRKKQLENLEPPLHPEMEELQSKISQLAVTSSAVKELEHDIRVFLGWTNKEFKKSPSSEFSWTSTINKLGTANTGGNYEKGTAFEQVVHKSLKFIGFGLDPNANGGAGGMDLCCTSPYKLVGECKAGQSIPDGTVEQLIKIGTRHLGSEGFQTAVKLIIGPGQPTTYLQKSAQESAFGVSIINPMSLQNLVKLQERYPGSINLVEFKSYLIAGQCDHKIQEYIEKIRKDIKIRARLIESIKQLGTLEPSRKQFGVMEIRAQYNAKFFEENKTGLDDQTVHDLLIELSSPLTGYLGRNQFGTGLQTDRFYFLRDLSVD